jgi:hypothetical protein
MQETNDVSHFLTGGGGIMAAQIKFLRSVHNLRISGNQCTEFI